MRLAALSRLPTFPAYLGERPASPRSMGPQITELVAEHALELQPSFLEPGAASSRSSARTGGSRDDRRPTGPAPTVAGAVGRPRCHTESLIAAGGYGRRKYRCLLWQRGIKPLFEGFLFGSARPICAGISRDAAIRPADRLRWHLGDRLAVRVHHHPFGMTTSCA